MTYVRIRSWHAIGHLHRPRGSYGDLVARTLCGRDAIVEATLDSGLTGGVTEVHPTSDELPAERSCESCLRSLAREDDRDG